MDTTTPDALEKELVSDARNFLRDFPQFFEVDLGPLNVTTVRLPHPLVDACSLQVFQAREITEGDEDAEGHRVRTMVEVPGSDYSVDERNGLLKFGKLDYLNHRTVVAGYYTTWFLDADLRFHTSHALQEMFYGQDDFNLATMPHVYKEVTAMGGVVQALWSLATELAMDIDVSTPEGMFIPARQRFSQVMQLAGYWEGEFKHKAAMLNIGLDRLEVFRLRRVSLMTNRYVPVYREREFDDRNPPKRLYPPIPWGVSNQPDEDGVEVFTADEIFKNGEDLGFGGWGSLGTRGDDC